MALQSVRLRRSLTSLSAALRCYLSSPSPLPNPSSIAPPPRQQSLQSSAFSLRQPRTFSSAAGASRPPRNLKLYKEGDEIDENTVLFEGCDYNHWLITVDFRDQPQLSPEEKVATYERICAQGLKISIEEAKKRIYACSTTTYEGFQAVMTEEESEQFRDIPRVVFILPDSYIDPVNKEYGGDKYENGVITHRPPPVQYNRGRSRRPMPNQQQSPQYGQQGPMKGGGGNYGPPQNYPPQQNYGSPQNYPPQQNYQSPQNYPSQQNYGSPQNYPPQQNYQSPQNYPPQQNYGSPQNYPPQQNYQPPQNYPRQQNYGPPGQGERMSINDRGHAPRGTDAYQANRTGSMPPYQGNYNQGNQGNKYPQNQSAFPQGNGRDYGSSVQRDFEGENHNNAPMHTENYGQRANPGYGQGYVGEGQNLPQMEQRNLQGDQRHNASMGQTGTGQGRY